MPKAILLEEQLRWYLTYSWEGWRVYSFPERIGLRVNVIEQLLFELANYNTTTPRGAPIDYILVLERHRETIQH